MTTAGQVAQELRKLADALEVEPSAEVVKPWITFYTYDKEPFLSVARLLPRPLSKEITGLETSWARLNLKCEGFTAIGVAATVPQSKTCELVEPAMPAVYRCDPILSALEEEKVSA